VQPTLHPARSLILKINAMFAKVVEILPILFSVFPKPEVIHYKNASVALN
jgi:hypothetical protein